MCGTGKENHWADVNHGQYAAVRPTPNFSILPPEQKRKRKQTSDPDSLALSIAMQRKKNFPLETKRLPTKIYESSTLAVWNIPIMFPHTLLSTYNPIHSVNHSLFKPTVRTNFLPTIEHLQSGRYTYYSLVRNTLTVPNPTLSTTRKLVHSTLINYLTRSIFDSRVYFNNEVDCTFKRIWMKQLLVCNLVMSTISAYMHLPRKDYVPIFDSTNYGYLSYNESMSGFTLTNVRWYIYTVCLLPTTPTRIT
jgi:hypothetical protein